MRWSRSIIGSPPLRLMRLASRPHGRRGTDLAPEPVCLNTSAGVPSSPQSRGGSRWPRTIQIRQDASVTTTEPAIAVARDQVIDRVADHPWDQVEDPCPLPARKPARNAQRGFGFYIGLAGRDERKGIWAIRIDAELLSERTSLGQLDGNEAKIAAAVTFADEAAAARAQDTYAVEQDQAVRPVDAAGTFR